jgi:hypothetical protein
MTAFPKAEPGLVFRYRYLRIWQYERGEQVGKERPCCILFPLAPGEEVFGPKVHDEASGAVVQRYVARDNDIIIVLVQTDPPGTDQIGIELSIADKRHVGLPADRPSYAIVSEVNVDTWPNPDISFVPGRRNAYTYEKPLPAPTVTRMLKAFLHVRSLGKTSYLIRQP